jgi:hypothetical protein
MIWIAIVCSPAVVFAVERANFDLLVFAILVLSAQFGGHPLYSAACILTSSFLKLYPIVGLTALIGYGRRGWVVFLLGLVAFAFYLFWIREWLPFIFGSLDGNTSCAFGAGVLVGHLGNPHLQWALQVLFAVTGFFVGMAGLFFGKNLLRVSCKVIFMARLGLPIFLLLFLSGSQFDYKMIFLLLAVPAVFEILEKGKSFYRNAAVLWMGCFLGCLYWMFFSGESCLRNFILKQILASLLFFLSAFLSGVFYSEVFPVLKRLKPIRRVGF